MAQSYNIPANFADSHSKPSTTFRKFVISYGRLFGHGILGYREQASEAFSRPFGKETPYANAHGSPHHCTAKRSYGSASGRTRPCHTTITGVTRPHGLQGCRAGPTDQPHNGPRVGLCQPYSGHMATALSGPGFPGSARCQARRASANACLPHACPGHLGGPCVASSTGSHRHQVALRCNRRPLARRSAHRLDQPLAALASPARRRSQAPPECVRAQQPR